MIEDEFLWWRDESDLRTPGLYVELQYYSGLQFDRPFRMGYSPKSFVYILISLGPGIPALPAGPHAPSVKRGCRAPIPSKGKQRFGTVSYTKRSIELQSAVNQVFIFALVCSVLFARLLVFVISTLVAFPLLRLVLLVRGVSPVMSNRTAHSLIIVFGFRLVCRFDSIACVLQSIYTNIVMR